MEHIFKEIEAERQRQDAKWGEQNHHPMEWLAILGEEVGEVNKAALETYFMYDHKAAQDYSEYRKELVQVAAVAVKMIQNIDQDAASPLHQTILKTAEALKIPSESINITVNLEAIHKGNMNLITGTEKPLSAEDCEGVIKTVTEALLRAVKL